MQKKRILGISGSLRENASNSIIIKAIEGMVGNDIEYTIYDDLGKLPHFNGSEEEIDSVTHWRNLVKKADGVIICSPEYAFGMPGSLKNALDWTVGSGEFTDKPVAYITASLSGERAHESMGHVLTALSTKKVDGAELLIPFIRAKVKEGVIQNDVRYSINNVVNALVKSL
jgi:NAD(P)H-dependent FMN reductase